jgi:17 kDa outer membrane surface antigen
VLGAIKADRQPRYSRTTARRLSRRPLRSLARRLAAFTALVALGLGTGGCSYRLGGLTGRDADKPELTSSVKPTRAAHGATPAHQPSEADLALTKAAVNDVLSRGEQDTSMPWENPRTGARGTVTPIATAYTQDGFTCRDFLASYVREGSESWLQGEACRVHQGKWEVKSLRPQQRT